MKRKGTVLILAVMMVLAMSMTSFAYGWQPEEDGRWWYGTNEDNSTWYTRGWYWIDGNCYYFYDDGYMAADTVIDGSTVNADGQWTVDGKIQTQADTGSSSEQNGSAEYATNYSGKNFEKAVFNRFNSFASENGLGGTYIYVDGKIDSKIDLGGFAAFYFIDNEGNRWAVEVSDREDSDTQIVDSLVGGTEARIYGEYSGYSTVLDTPDIRLIGFDFSIAIPTSNGNYVDIFKSYDYWIKRGVEALGY